MHVRDIVHVGRTYRHVGDVHGRRHFSTATSASNDCAKEITSKEFGHIGDDANLLKLLNERKHTCGSLRLKDAGKEISLVGWISDESQKFIHLEDGYGTAQIIIKDKSVRGPLNDATESNLLLIHGRIVARQLSHITYNNPTGEVELVADSIRILNGDDANATSTPPTSHQLSRTSINKFTYRTHHCGELRAEDADREVTLCGWLEYSRLKKFFTLRDGYGQTQILVPDQLADSIDLGTLNFETILKVNGVVRMRPPKMFNRNMKTGEIEIELGNMEVLNAAKNHLPIEMRTFNRSNEPLRMEYRYIDLRFADMQRNLRTRSNVLMKMREYLINDAGFVEVETPTLFRRTPGVSCTVHMSW